MNQGRPAPKQCPSVGQGVTLAGGTKMMLGVRVNRTWNHTTKQWEFMSRPAISEGTNGGKRFAFGPSKLI
jgi:hypothetical protein